MIQQFTESSARTDRFFSPVGAALTLAWFGTGCRAVQKCSNFPEGAELRRELRTLIREQMRRMWPGEVIPPAQAKHQTQSGDTFHLAIQSLPAPDDTQRVLKAQAATLRPAAK